MTKLFFVALFAVALAVVSFSEKTSTVEAANCDPAQLSPCMSSLISGVAPSPGCCGKLREQQPCFCGYIRNPALSQFVNNPNARRVAVACNVPWPRC